MTARPTPTRRWPHGSGRPVKRWPLVLIAAPAAVAVWSGWVGLGELCGFGIIHPLPGIWDTLRINTAITLPIGRPCLSACQPINAAPARLSRRRAWRSTSA